MRTNKRKPLLSRFMSMVDMHGPNGCWNWTAGKIRFGYGMFWRNRKSVRAHKASYEFFIGELSEGEIILHRCDNRACVNPFHLSSGSYQDNANDMIAKGRSLIGERNHNSVLTEDIVKRIKLETITNKSEIARKYKMGRSAIFSILNGDTWKHVNV